MILTTRAKAGEQMVSVHPSGIRVPGSTSSPGDLHLQAQQQPQPGPDQSVLSSVRKGLKYLRLAAQKQARRAAIPALTLFLGFHH